MYETRVSLFWTILKSERHAALHSVTVCGNLFSCDQLCFFLKLVGQKRENQENVFGSSSGQEVKEAVKAPAAICRKRQTKREKQKEKCENRYAELGRYSLHLRSTR